MNTPDTLPSTSSVVILAGWINYYKRRSALQQKTLAIRTGWTADKLRDLTTAHYAERLSFSDLKVLDSALDAGDNLIAEMNKVYAQVPEHLPHSPMYQKIIQAKMPEFPMHPDDQAVIASYRWPKIESYHEPIDYLVDQANEGKLAIHTKPEGSPIVLCLRFMIDHKTSTNLKIWTRGEANRVPAIPGVQGRYGTDDRPFWEVNNQAAVYWSLRLIMDERLQYQPAIRGLSRGLKHAKRSKMSDLSESVINLLELINE